jgi:tRNA-specific 2-thiouridylase
MEDAQGRVLGRHVGLSFYTLGQRQGLGIGGIRPEPVKRARRGRPSARQALAPGRDQAHSGAAADDLAVLDREAGAESRAALDAPDAQGAPARQAARAAGEHAPWYVAHKDLARNALVVVQGHDHPLLLSSALEADDTCWIAGHAPPPGAYAAKTRYRQADAPCRFAPQEAGGFGLDFEAPQWAVTPGQSAVLYDGEVCLGGGVIAQTRRGSRSG